MTPNSGDMVRVHYRGTLDDGTEFDSSSGREPLEFEVGAGEVIPGFDNAVSELEVGQSTTITIPACDAYGERMDDAMQEFPLEAFGDRVPELGWAVELQAEDGSNLAAIVVEVTEKIVALDFNHPLAGEPLTFQIELVEIVDGGSSQIVP